MIRWSPTSLIPLVWTVLVLIGSPAPAQQQTGLIFEDDFSGKLKLEWHANKRMISTTPKGNQKYLGPFGGESVLLNVDDLPEHEAIRVSLDVLIIRSWDGNSPVEGPDILYIYSDDGRLLYATSFSWTSTQAYPGFFSVHTAPPGSGAMRRDTLGFTHENVPRDGIFHVEFAIPHRAVQLGLRFVATTQSAISDEAWGITHIQVTKSQPPALTFEQLGQAWEQLGAENPAVAASAVWTLACGGEPAVALLTQRLAGEVIPADVELLDPTHVMGRRLPTTEPDGFALADPVLRRNVLGAHVLQLIGTEAATKGRQGLVVKPLGGVKTVRLTVTDAATNKPIPFAPIWGYFYSTAMHASALTDDRGRATFDIPSQGVTNLLFQNARCVYVPVGIRATLATLQPEIQMPLERAVPIGGMVVDDAQKPVDGATVVVSMTQSVAAPMIARLGSMSVTTDEQGRWSMDLGPQKPLGVQIGVRSSLLASEAVTSKGYLDQLTDLQAGKLTLVMPRPSIVRGHVVDADTGAALEQFQVAFAAFSGGAQVAQWQQVRVQARNGSFEIPIPPNFDGVIVRIDAEGYLTSMSELIPTKGGEKQLEMKLFRPR